MPIPLGVLAAAGAGVAGASYELIQTTILGSDTASLTINSLNTFSQYKHLQLRCVIQDTASATLRINYNGTSGGTEYATHRLQSDGALSSQSNLSNDRMVFAALPSRGNESNTFMAWVINILDFSATNKNKTLRAFAGTAQTSYNRVGLYSGLWANTAAITSITLDVSGSQLASSSRFSIYGIRA